MTSTAAGQHDTGPRKRFVIMIEFAVHPAGLIA